jgi:hypothetical protein
MIGLAAAALLLLSACSDDDAPSREEMIDEAVDAGLDEETATCFVDGLLEEFGESRVNEMVTEFDDPADLPEDEQAAIEDVTLGCIDLGDVEDPGVSIPDVSVPDVTLE